MLTKAQEKTLKEYVRQTPAERVARGMVLSEVSRPGLHRLLPLMGYVGVRAGKPYLLIQGLLLRIVEDKQVGMLSWTIPILPETKVAAVNVLASMGWDGRLWPNDAGWPDEEPQEAKGLQKLLHECRLAASMVFPPVPGAGSRTIRVLVAKGNGTPFPLPPELQADDLIQATPELMGRFEALVADSGLFQEEPPTTDLVRSRIRYISP